MAVTASKDPAVRSVYIDGPVPSKSIKDVFGKTLDQIQSQIKEKKITQIESMFNDWRGSAKSFFEGLISKIKGAIPKLPIEQMKEYMNQAKQLIKVGREFGHIYKDFKDKNWDALLGRIAPFVGDGIMSGINEGLRIYDVVKNGDWHSFEGIMSAISELTGIDIKDALGITQLQGEIQAILELAQQLNIPGVVDMLKQKNRDDIYMNETLIHGFDINASLGQFEMMYQFMDLLDGQSILFHNPNIIRDILQNFTYPISYKPVDQDKLRERVLKLLFHIDPNWDKEKDANTTRFKLEPWTMASDDAISLFSKHPDYSIPCAIARDFPALTLKDALNETYPFLRLS